MSMLVIALPIAPGKTEQFMRFTEELAGPRHDEFAASRERLGVRERTFYQTTSTGDLVLVSLEGDDPAGAFSQFAHGNDDFTLWFTQQVSEIHGVDLTAPPPGPLPELRVDSAR